MILKQCHIISILYYFIFKCFQHVRRARQETLNAQPSNVCDMCRNGTLYVNEEEDKSSEHDTWERNVALASIRARMEDSTVSNFHNAYWNLYYQQSLSPYFNINSFRATMAINDKLIFTVTVLERYNFLILQSNSSNTYHFLRDPQNRIFD